MLEFLVALVLYIGILFGVVGNTDNLNVLTTNFSFTVVKDESDIYNNENCGYEYYSFLPIEYRGEFLKDGVCYTAPDLTGKIMELPAGSLVQLSGISESGSTFSFWKNSEKWYVSSSYVDIISDEVLGIPIGNIPIEEIPDIFIAEDDDCDIAFCYGLFRMLPDYIQEAVYASGFEIVITNRDLQEAYDRDNKVAGIIIFREHRIYINNATDSIKYSLYHEIGHLLDYLWDYASETEEFLKIFGEEQDEIEYAGLFVDGYQKTNSQEYFAVAIQTYFMLGSKLEESAPRTYEYIWRYLCKMTEKNQ